MELFCNYFADRIACRDFCNSHLYCRCVRDIDISVPVCVGGIEMNIIQYVQLREITLNSCRVGNSNIAVAVNITQLYAVEKRVVDVVFFCVMISVGVIPNAEGEVGVVIKCRFCDICNRLRNINIPLFQLVVPLTSPKRYNPLVVGSSPPPGPEILSFCLPLLGVPSRVAVYVPWYTPDTV